MLVWAVLHACACVCVYEPQLQNARFATARRWQPAGAISALRVWLSGHPPLHDAVTTERGGGGVKQARISAVQILYKNFVRNLFGVSTDLCR